MKADRYLAAEAEMVGWGKIFIKVEYFDLGSGERNLTQSLYGFYSCKVLQLKTLIKGHGFFYNGQKKQLVSG